MDSDEEGEEKDEDEIDVDELDEEALAWYQAQATRYLSTTCIIYHRIIGHSI